MFHLDVSKVDLEKHVLLLLMRHHGSPCAPARAAATACMQTHEMERAQDGPRGLRSRMGANTRELDVLDIGMKTDRIRTDITDIIFVFIFMFGFGFEYG
jgi:hypothetical protein